MADEIYDITSAVLNSGLEKSATLTINADVEDPTVSSINVIFVAEYERNNMGVMKYEGSNPMALADKNDVVGIKNRRDTLTISGTTYNIQEIKPDSKNFVIMELTLD